MTPLMQMIIFEHGLVRTLLKLSFHTVIQFHDVTWGQWPQINLTFTSNHIICDYNRFLRWWIRFEGLFCCLCFRGRYRYQSYKRVRSRIRDIINLIYDVIGVTQHHLWALYALNMQPRCIKTPHSVQNWTGNTLVKVPCRYDRQFCWFRLVKLKNHTISENLTFNLP